MINILLVEDEPEIAMLTQDLLMEEFKTPNVIWVKDGVEGMRVSETFDFDVLVLDVKMPRMTGTQLAERLSKPYIFWTGFFCDANWKDMPTNVPVVHKPNFEELKPAIEEVINVNSERL